MKLIAGFLCLIGLQLYGDSNKPAKTAPYLKILQIYKQNNRIFIEAQCNVPCHLEKSADLQSWETVKQNNEKPHKNKQKTDKHHKIGDVRIKLFTEEIDKPQSFYRVRAKSNKNI